MTFSLSLVFLGVVFFASALSGVFGMAGGLILMGFLLAWMPATTAIAVHGIIQMGSNASRAWLSRRYIDWHIVAWIVLGVVVAALLLASLRYTPSENVVLLLIGGMPVLVWLPRRWFRFDVSRPVDAILCGLVAGGLTIAAGVSGPTIDIGFVRTRLDRRTVVASKAAIQVIAHTIKVVFYFQAVLALERGQWGWIVLAIPLSFLGTRSGNAILKRLTDASFRGWTRWLVTLVGGYYAVRGVIGLI